ncbi:MAG: DUF799 family lipoprotein [Deltaproteobacteria bacterium]|nr:DUF799 family lipoprotein [Deltaproteobacteria bacterium]
MSVLHRDRERVKPAIALAGLALAVCVLVASACAPIVTDTRPYHDPEMDFGAIRTIAVLPFANLSRDQLAALRVRDVVAHMLRAEGSFYVVPEGEVSRGIARLSLVAADNPTVEESKKLGAMISADALITGVIKEYGELHSAAATANAISMGLKMIETQTGKVVWSGQTTKGGVGIFERMLGGGGQPMNIVTEKAVRALIDALFEGGTEAPAAPAAAPEEPAAPPSDAKPAVIEELAPRAEPQSQPQPQPQPQPEPAPSSPR